MVTDADTLQPDACYLALKARDARFDGCFFTGVTSTRIYCRPVCRVRTPKRENCRFFPHAAAAERAGFRPCLRCRPELAPGAPAWSTQDAGAMLARQAARLLDEPDAWGDQPPTAQALAARLGVTDRHVRRLFDVHFGVSPLQYLQTRRLLTAKQLLVDTRLPITQVALISGWSSVRRFNAAFAQHYGLNPTGLRRDGSAAPEGDGITVRLAYRPPLDTVALLGFFAQRALPGMETADGVAGTLARTLAVPLNGKVHRGWLQLSIDPGRCQVHAVIAPGLRAVLPHVIRRVRSALDLDADPQAINAALHGAFPGQDGLRVPGAFDGWELAVRAVLGQQVTVAAGRTFARRLLERFGEPLATGVPGLDRLFPAPAVLAAAEPDALGALGIVRQRQAAIVALARAVDGGGLTLNGGADVPATLVRLVQLPGIGPWTAQYIAMRALRWPDAFPAGDVALHKALGVQDRPHPARAAEAASQPWRPWRSYAVIRAWSRAAVPA